MSVQLEQTVEPAPPVVDAESPVLGGLVPSEPGPRQPAPRRAVVVNQRVYPRMAAVPAVAYAVCVAIQPVPAGPAPVLPWWYGAVDVASLVLLFVVCFALGRARSWAPVAVVASGIGMVAETVTCPASGHHHVLGWWWYVQLALSVGVLLGGLVLRRARPR